jgi:hypothetical protein
MIPAFTCLRGVRQVFMASPVAGTTKNLTAFKINTKKSFKKIT